MDAIDNWLKVANFAMTFVTAIVFAWYWNERKSVLDRYQYLDKAYQELLSLYLANPRFGDQGMTQHYAQHFSGDELWRYHYFAMKVHTTMETLFDLSKGMLKLSRVTIPAEWQHIFRYHTALHREWLKANRALHEEAYVELALAK